MNNWILVFAILNFFLKNNIVRITLSAINFVQIKNHSKSNCFINLTTGQKLKKKKQNYLFFMIKENKCIKHWIKNKTLSINKRLSCRH